MVSTIEHDQRGVTEYFIQGDLLRAAERYIEDQKQQELMIAEAKLNPVFEEKNALLGRIFESTFHPSQIHSRKLKRLFWDKIREARENHRHYRNTHEGQPWQKNAIKQIAREIIDIIYRETACYETDMEDAKIPANAKLKPACITFLHGKINAWTHTATNASNINNFIENLETAIPSTITDVEDFSRPFTSGEIDESWEMTGDTKTALLTGVHPVHCEWIDFDGAKRPQTIQFSMYGELVMEDIRYIGKNDTLAHDEKKCAVEAYALFLRIDILIDALTKYFQEMNGTNDIPEAKKNFLEETMNTLKKRRRKNIETMIKIRNTCLKRKPQTGMVLSERVRFLPRLDHDAVKTLIKQQARKKLSPKEKTELQTIRAIKGQISDMHHIANVKECHDGSLCEKSKMQPVPQVMIANAEKMEEIEALHTFLSGDGLDDIAIVPLFESKATTTADFINTYLETLWTRLGEAAFQKRIKEIFFAGSDLSKEIGSFATRVQVWQAGIVIKTFNQRHGTNIQIKLGTGEALNRQMGYLDPEGYLNLIKGKITDPNGEQNAEAQEAVAFLTVHFGAQWKEKLKRKPSGYHWLLERYPWIDVFTKQSRAREMQALTIEPSRLGKLSKSLGALREEKLKTQEGPSQTLVAAAETEQQFYQTIMGDPAADRYKPTNGFLNLPALIEIFAKIGPVLRDRGLARSGSGKGVSTELTNLKKSGVEARAIASTTSASFIFPLALLGHGSMLEKTEKDGGTEALQELLKFLPVKNLLREMKCYEVATKTVFQLMRENGFTETAELLSAEWERLIRYKPVLQEALWQSLLPEDMDADCPVRTWKTENPERQKFVTLLVPGTRELLDDTFQSRRTQLFARNFKTHGSTFLSKGLQYLKNADEYRVLVEEAVTAIIETESSEGDVEARKEEIRIEIAQTLDCGTISKNQGVVGTLDATLKLRLLEKAASFKPLKEFINEKEYSRFLKAMAYSYGRIG